MIRYANSDISDGIKSLKIGIGNIIASLNKKKVLEYTLPYKLNYMMAIGALQEMFEDASFLYSDKYINIIINGSSIDIQFNPDNTKFILMT